MREMREIFNERDLRSFTSLGTHPTQNKYMKIVVLKKMLVLSDVNHGQSIERRIFISRPVETTDLDKYAKKCLKMTAFIQMCDQWQMDMGA